MSNKVKKQKEHRILVEVRDEPQAGGIASSDFQTRERSLQSLTIWLSKHENITEMDLLRLWKAIFYCFWHSDKVPVQTALAERLSELMTQIPDEVGQLYFKVFVKTMRREWFGIDRHRMDKFMMLIRQFYAQHLRYLQANDWNKKLVSSFASFWIQEVFFPSDTIVASGFAYHIADIFLIELNRILNESGTSISSHSTISLLLSPFCTTLADTRDNVMVKKLQNGLFENILDELTTSPALQHLNTEKMGQMLFDLGARKETRGMNREALYAVSAGLEKIRAAQKKNKLMRDNNNNDKETVEKEVKDATPKIKKNKKSDVVTENKSITIDDNTSSLKKKKKKSSIDHSDVDANLKPTSLALGDDVKEKTKEKKKKKNKKKQTTSPDSDKVPHVSSETKKNNNTHQHTTNGVTTNNNATNNSADKKRRHNEPVNLSPPPSKANTKTTTLPERKSVRFSLKRNLVMTIGQQPLPEDIRTPPSSKPKGSALKKVSTIRPGSTPGKGAKRKLSLEGAKHNKVSGSHRAS